MAVDEAILESCAGSDAENLPPTLRLYGWDPHALSLGRSQPAAAAHDPEFLRRRGIDLVRRPSGGLAVLHGAERTYSIVGSWRRPPFAGGVLETYRAVAEALERALRGLGADARASVGAQGAVEARAAVRGEAGPACFALTSAHEIAAGGRKLVGSAQLRRGPAFLQHGSIPLAIDRPALAGALGCGVAEGAFTDLRTAAGRDVSEAEVDAALVAAFERRLGVRLRVGRLTAEESSRASRLRSWKYLSASWTLAGRIGEREARHLALSAAR